MTRVSAPLDRRPTAPVDPPPAARLELPPAAAAFTPERRRTRIDVLFAVAVTLLIAVHLTIFVAVLILAPTTPAETRSLQQMHLPQEVARALVLPFHALLLVSLFVLGRRAGGRWAGFGAMLAVLALNLRADPAALVYGPAVATGGWIAAALLAGALAVLPRRPLVAAALLGAATVFHSLTVLALPAFLLALALFPPAAFGRPWARLARLAAFTGVWAIPAGLGQVLRLVALGAPDDAATLAPFFAEFRPHPLVPWLEQQRLLFAAWHFQPLVTVSLALFLFTAAGIGVVRSFVVPRPQEAATRPRAIAVLRRFPMELWAAGLTLVLFSAWWAFSGLHVIIEPNLPALVAIAPLITAMAYKGSKWLITLHGLWAVAAVVYLAGLILARSTQLIITLVQAFHP